MRKFTLIQIALCGTLLASAAAFAQAGGPKTAPTDPTPPVSPEQKPAVAKPTPAEAAAAAAAMKTKDAEFAQLDTDKDGFVTKKEAGVHPQLLTDFAKLDANKDGKLSADEYGKHH